MMKTIRCGRIVVGLLVLLALAGKGTAQEVRLSLTTMSPAGSNNVTKFFEPYAKRFNEEGKGVVSVDLKYGSTLANFGNVFERVADDVVQIGWSAVGSSRGRLPLSEVSLLPFLGNDNVAQSIAWWRLYKSGALNDEMKDIVPLWLIVSTPNNIHLRNAPSSLENLGGLKINVAGGRVQADAVANLGGLAVSLLPSDLYVGLQRGTVDGAMIGWSAFGPYKLAEVTSHHLNVPMGGGAHLIFMSRKRYDSLSPAVRKIVDNNSGDRLVKEFAEFFLRESNDQRDAVQASGNHKIVDLTAAQIGTWQRKVDPAIQTWVKDHPGRDKVLASFRKFLAEAEAGK